MEDEPLKYFRKRDLIEANNASIRENRHRRLKEEFLNGLPDDRNYPVAHCTYHTKDEVRVMILFDKKYTVGYLDISVYRYNTLPTAVMNDDGIFEYEDSKITDSKRPYRRGREWTEKVVRTPVRKQDKFEKGVLEAYNNQCAVTNM